MFMPRLFYTAIFMFFLCIPLPADASDYQVQEKSKLLGLSIGTGFEFETGGYGTDQTIDSWRIPLVIDWAPNDFWGMSLEIPYVHQSSTGDTVLLGAGTSPVRHGNGRMSESSTTQTTTSEEGLGDMSLDVDLTLLGDGKQTPKLLVLLHAKLPTADEEKGLGTGEFDWGGGLGVYKKFGLWSTYAETLYLLPGTSQIYDPSPYWEWQAALSYRTTNNLRPGLSLSGGTAPFEGTDNPLEINARLAILGENNRSYSFSISRGLSEASPDWGIGLFAFFDF